MDQHDIDMLAAHMTLGMENQGGMEALSSVAGSEQQLRLSLTQFAPRLKAMLEATNLIYGDEVSLPGVIEFDIAEPFGDWFARKLQQEGRIPDTLTGLESLGLLVTKFYENGVDEKTQDSLNQVVWNFIEENQTLDATTGQELFASLLASGLARDGKICETSEACGHGQLAMISDMTRNLPSILNEFINSPTLSLMRFVESADTQIEEACKDIGAWYAEQIRAIKAAPELHECTEMSVRAIVNSLSSISMHPSSREKVENVLQDISSRRLSPKKQKPAI